MIQIKQEIMSLWSKNQQLIGGNLAWLKSELPHCEDKEIRSALNSLVRGKYLSSKMQKGQRQYFIFQRKYYTGENNPSNNREFLY